MSHNILVLHIILSKIAKHALQKASHKRLIQCNIYMIFPFTFSSRRIQSEVCRGRGKPQPPVRLRLQVLLKELLGFLILDECQVSSTSLTPTLSTEERTPETHKLITGAIKALLVFWAGESLSLLLGTRWTEKEESAQ